MQFADCLSARRQEIDTLASTSHRPRSFCSSTKAKLHNCSKTAEAAPRMEAGN